MPNQTHKSWMVSNFLLDVISQKKQNKQKTSLTYFCWIIHPCFIKDYKNKLIKKKHYHWFKKYEWNICLPHSQPRSTAAKNYFPFPNSYQTSAHLKRKESMMCPTVTHLCIIIFCLRLLKRFLFSSHTFRVSS